MTELQYLLYAQLFNSLLALHVADEHQSISFAGDVVGAALRRWASARGFEVESETLSSESVGGSWTVLRARLPCGWDITVHLDAVTPAPPHQPAAPVEPLAVADQPEIEF
jgi:hypothetical protein